MFDYFSYHFMSHNNLFRTSFGVFFFGVTSEIKSSDVIFNVVCELSQPWARQNFPALLKIEQTLSLR